MSKEKAIIEKALSKGFLLSPSCLDIMKNEGDCISQLSSLENNVAVILPEHLKLPEKIKEAIEESYEVVVNYLDKPGKNTLREFVSYFRKRFELATQALKTHQGMIDITSISRIRNMMPNEQACFAGMVTEKNITKNKNYILKVEDLSGSINVIIGKNNKETFEQAKDICLDETIGFIGAANKDVVYVNQLVWPDIPLHREIKKAQVEEYALFIGDLHIGSKAFMKQEFELFIDWLRKESEAKISYIFIVGDLVDGAGIYPDQEDDLDIKDIFEQYGVLAKYLEQFPKSAKIFMCPGNHDAIRLSEPQPALYKDFAEPIYNLSNVFLVSNPAIINIAKSKNFSGLSVLLYHGSSFPFYADNIESIRLKGGQEKTDLISQYLLKRRHLAPSHGSSMYMPNYETDPLFINTVPDFFVTGHIHRAMISEYRGITCINCSCWISQTKYQEKIGLKPEPARAVLVNLATRKTKMYNFMEQT
jgi:DNA polymerase II small subunit